MTNLAYLARFDPQRPYGCAGFGQKSVSLKEHCRAPSPRRSGISQLLGIAWPTRGNSLQALVQLGTHCPPGPSAYMGAGAARCCRAHAPLCPLPAGLPALAAALGPDTPGPTTPQEASHLQHRQQPAVHFQALLSLPPGSGTLLLMPRRGPQGVAAPTLPLFTWVFIVVPVALWPGVAQVLNSQGLSSTSAGPMGCAVVRDHVHM